MSIRKQLVYDGHTKQTVGFCDLGAGPEENSGEASEVLVFMLVGLTSRWKAPIAYYLTQGLTSDTQGELLLHCLEAVSSTGLKVHCVTMDGHASNMSMVKRLGVQLDVQTDVKAYFILPGTDEKIFVMFDPCHMIKLVRNMWEAYKCFQSPQGLFFSHEVELYIYI